MTYTKRDFMKIMKKNGFAPIEGRGKGSHTVYTNGNRKISMSNSYNKMIIQRLIKEYNLVV